LFDYPELKPVPSYPTLRRFMKANGLDKRRRVTSRQTDGADCAEDKSPIARHCDATSAISRPAKNAARRRVAACLIGCEPVHTSGPKSNAFSKARLIRAPLYPMVPQLRRTAMKHSMKTLLAIVAFGAVLAAPAFARQTQAQAQDARRDAQTYSHRTTVPAKCMLDEGNGRYTPCDAF
jgi:hypothetical protein